MLHLHQLISYRSVLVCAIILWIIGAMWFSPALFGKPWAALIGRKTGEKPKRVVWGMIASFIGDFVLAFVMVHIIVWSHANSALDGLHIALLTWVGFVAAILYPNTVYEGRGAKYFMITGGYWLLGFLVIGALLGVWH
ncbi:MAG: DUF1761 domain-containing protein [Terracidiphilus sp.]